MVRLQDRLHTNGTCSVSNGLISSLKQTKCKVTNETQQESNTNDVTGDGITRERSPVCAGAVGCV